MPLYEYKCDQCEKVFEELMPLGGDDAPACPACGSERTRKQMSLFGGLGQKGGGSCASSGFS
jgi:putative FmdB family regulatory protein